MKNISIIHILGLLASIAILLTVPQIVNWVFQNHFESNILPNNPRADFNLLFDDSRISYDKNFMIGIWLVIFGIFMYLIFLDFKLKSINDTKEPIRNLQLSIFMQRIIAYLIIFVAFPMNFVVFDKRSSSELLSFSDKMILPSFMLVMFNSVALLPYLSQRNIAPFFKLKDVLIFNLGIVISMTIMLYLGVSQYLAPAISGILAGFAFFKKMTDAWNHIENYFEIKEKRFNEMF